jgi:hypothetical protein
MFPATTNIKVENQMGNFSIGKTCHIAGGGFAIENIGIPHTGKEKKIQEKHHAKNSSSCNNIKEKCTESTSQRSQFSITIFEKLITYYC